MTSKTLETISTPFQLRCLNEENCKQNGEYNCNTCTVKGSSVYIGLRS